MLQFVEHLLKRRTTVELYFFAIEELVGSDIVEAALYTLDCNAFHIL